MSDTTICLNCGYTRKDHCCCGSVCMKAEAHCSRFRDVNGLAPCPTCKSRVGLKPVYRDGVLFTYRCFTCYPKGGHKQSQSSKIFFDLLFKYINHKGKQK